MKLAATISRSDGTLVPMRVPAISTGVCKRGEITHHSPSSDVKFEENAHHVSEVVDCQFVSVQIQWGFQVVKINQFQVHFPNQSASQLLNLEHKCYTKSSVAYMCTVTKPEFRHPNSLMLMKHKVGSCSKIKLKQTCMLKLNPAKHLYRWRHETFLLKLQDSAPWYFSTFVLPGENILSYAFSSIAPSVDLFANWYRPLQIHTRLWKAGAETFSESGKRRRRVPTTVWQSKQPAVWLLLLSGLQQQSLQVVSIYI